MKRITISGQKSTLVEEYLARLDPKKQAALHRLRKIIQETIPKAEECICYGVPAFRLHGRFLLAFGATAKHCAFYPGAVVEAHKQDLKGFNTSKGTIRFQPENPLPKALVRKLVKAQVERKGR